MKAPTVGTYPQYVLFRMAARTAIAHARAGRSMRKLGLPHSAELCYVNSRAAMASAKLYWSQVELMEV